MAGQETKSAQEAAQAAQRVRQVLHPKTLDDFQVAFAAAGLSAQSSARLITSANEPSVLEPLRRLLFEGRVRAGKTMGSQQWSWRLYGGQRDAGGEIRRKKGKMEFARRAVGDLIKAVNAAHEACKGLSDDIWNMPDLPEAIEAVKFDAMRGPLNTLHDKLKPLNWKKRVGRPSPLGMRDREFAAKIRALLGNISPKLKKNDTFINKLVQEVSALPADWKDVFPHKPSGGKK